jgi:hypothetical protein
MDPGNDQKHMSDGPWERPEIAIEVVKFGATASAITYLNNGYSEFEHTGWLSRTRTAMKRG